MEEKENNKKEEKEKEKNEEYECEICGRKFKNKRGLARHSIVHKKDEMKSEPVVKEEYVICDVCGQEILKENLMQHKKEKHKVTYVLKPKRKKTKVKSQIAKIDIEKKTESKKEKQSFIDWLLSGTEYE